MFKRTLPIFTKPTTTHRYAATLNMGLFTPQYPIQAAADQNKTQQIIENKLADPEKYQLQKVTVSKEMIDKLKEELMSSVIPTTAYW